MISTLLLALIVRALIPAGFMPATDRPFSFQICPDGFPAALLNDAGRGHAYADKSVIALPTEGEASAAHAGHHHDSGVPLRSSDSHDNAALAHLAHQHGSSVPPDSTAAQDGAALAHTEHEHGTSTLPHSSVTIDGAPLADTAHHHGGPLHNHGAASAEHCVFAAAAGVSALAFAATLFTPAAGSSAPNAAYLAPACESCRFRISQPRGPPALS